MKSEFKQFIVMLLLACVLMVLVSCCRCDGAAASDDSAARVLEQVDKYAADEFPLLPRPVTLPEEEIEQSDKPAVLAVDAKLSKLITIDFLETPIEDVLRMIAQEANIDIVKSPKVTGMVSATLNNVPVGEVLDNILAVHGYGYVKTNNMIRVVPASELVNTNEKMMSKVFRLTYADVTAVSEALKTFLTTTGNFKGSISVNPGTCNIVVTDTESKVKAMEDFIEEVDRVTEQVVVEVRIYDVTGDNSLNLDIQWNVGTVTENSQGGRVAQGTGGGIAYSDETELGKSPTGTPAQSSKVNTDPYAATSFDKTRGGAIRLGFFNDSLSIDMMLSALHAQGFAKLLANPSIMVLDNETANFEIIKEIPYKEESDASGGGKLTSTKFKEVGIKLQVTPHITRDDMLRMHIKPEFGIAEDQTRNPVTLEPIVPTVNTRRLDTITLLKSGQTVVLGGLKQYETTKDYWKTPILGDIPLIAPLFRSESETVKESELLIFIKPVIIKNTPVITASQTKILDKTEINSPKYPGVSRYSDESKIQAETDKKESQAEESPIQQKEDIE